VDRAAIGNRASNVWTLAMPMINFLRS